MKYIVYLLLLISISITGCKGASSPTKTPEPSPVPSQTATSQQDALVATQVAATLTAQVAPATPTKTAESTHTPIPSATVTSMPTVTVIPATTVAPTLAPTPVRASAAGKICYPAENIPAMTAYFQNSATGTVAELPIASGQITYTLTLTPGTYIAYAWLPDFSFGGLYSNAVPCGLKTSCTDHAARAFTVKAGQVTKGVDICDWYTGPFVIPYPPGQEPAATVGIISGSINYPEGNPPALKVVAFNLTTKFWYWVGTVSGDTYFSITDLPPGTYHVVAYTENGKAGGYADADHNLIDIELKSGQDVSIEINDWQGNFPANPVK
jgi:hypothetical protein